MDTPVKPLYATIDQKDLDRLRNRVGELEADVDMWRRRYEQANRQCLYRADERAHIVDQLHAEGYNLDEKGNLVILNS